MGASADGAEMMTFLAPWKTDTFFIRSAVLSLLRLAYILGVRGGLFGGCKHSSGLDHVLCSGSGPVDVGRVALAKDMDLGPVHVQELAVMLDLSCNNTIILIQALFFSTWLGTHASTMSRDVPDIHGDRADFSQ